MREKSYLCDMTNGREYIRIINLNSIFILLFMFFGLVIYKGTTGESSENNKKSVPSGVMVSQSSAVSSPEVRIHIFQKTWILNKDHFNLLAFCRSPLFEDKKSDIIISFLQDIRQNSGMIPVFIFRSHLFPPEIDEPPHLS
jgi:hypothetical protein